jgi:MFS family permease
VVIKLCYDRIPMTAFRHSFTHIRNLPFAFWIVIVATLINQLGNMAMVFLVPYLTIHLHFSLPLSSFIYAAFCAALLISGVMAGPLADRFGPSRVMATVLCTNAAVLLFMPLATHFLSILLMCLLWGCVFGMYKPAAQTFLTHIAPRDSFKVTFSIYRLAWNLGMSIGPAIGGYLAVHSFYSIFIFNGSANFLASLILILGLKYCPGVNHRPMIHPNAMLIPDFKAFKFDKGLRLLVLGMIPVCMVFYQNQSTMPIFINQELHLPLSFYGLLFTINTLMIVFFELPLNIATLHWPASRSLSIGSLLIGLGFCGFLLVSSAWEVAMIIVVFTIGEMILFPTASSYIAEIAPEHSRGNYMSILSTSINLGLLIGPWSGALLMHHLTSKSLWIACGLWGLLAAGIFQYLNKPKYDKLPP